MIGVDEYWSDAAHLHGAVNDALSVREWLLKEEGGNVPEEQLILLLSPLPGRRSRRQVRCEATKANIMVAINNLMDISGGQGERLYFYFAGHGLTTRVSNRDESALLATDFTTSTPTSRSRCARSGSSSRRRSSTTSSSSSTRAATCRSGATEPSSSSAAGRCRAAATRAAAGAAVHPLRHLAEAEGGRDPRHARPRARRVHGALLDGLRGDGAAKAWSWERQCYEVRWERLADYVRRTVTAGADPSGSKPPDEIPQVPQDAGSRGVPDRDGNPVLARVAAAGVEDEKLEVELVADPMYEEAQVVVIDGVGATVAEAVKVTGSRVTFELPPRTYAVRAVAPNFKEGWLSAPVDLYSEPDEPSKVKLHPLEEAATAQVLVRPEPEPQVVVEAPDPLSVVEVRDDKGSLKETWRATPDPHTLKPGFYQVRLVGSDALRTTCR